MLSRSWSSVVVFNCWQLHKRSAFALYDTSRQLSVDEVVRLRGLVAHGKVVYLYLAFRKGQKLFIPFLKECEKGWPTSISTHWLCSVIDWLAGSVSSWIISWLDSMRRIYAMFRRRFDHSRRNASRIEGFSSLQKTRQIWQWRWLTHFLDITSPWWMWC